MLTKESITDSELKEVVKQLENGQFYADLGGGVYKMELARKGEGRHGGYRSIVIFKSEFRSFFVYGFPKSKRDNISDKEANYNLTMTDEHINEWLKNQTLIEILQEEGKMKYKSEALKVIHQDAKEMYKIGAITEANMREYDEVCLSNPKTGNKYSPVYTDDNSVNVEHISHATA